jgi:2-polyprenyl-3-methyl-5-hydroxy-6-metoxy-1,4-benzoquinol methylase
MSRLMEWFNENISFPLRRRYLVKHLSPYLRNSRTILDLGASCGKLANELSKNLPDTEFVGLDTLVPSKTYIPVKKYDGKQIPFPSNSFDCVMIIDVLHHDKNPALILREAGRVSGKYILIKDHYWNNRLDFLFLKFADYLGNQPYGIELPYNFLRISDWESMIKETNFKINISQRFRYNKFDPVKNLIYLLEKNELQIY